MVSLSSIPPLSTIINADAISLQLQSKSPVEQLVHIMMMHDTENKAPYTLLNERTPNDYQAVYNLAVKNPELRQGIIHNGQTFALLCVNRGYFDLLTHLINEGFEVDFTTPCRLCGIENPQTTILHVLFGQIRQTQWFTSLFPEDYIKGIKELIKLIINECPGLLDLDIDREVTARKRAWNYNLAYLIPKKPEPNHWEFTGPTREDILAATAVKDPAANGSLEDKFISAVKNGDLKKVDALIAMDISLEARDSKNMTPFMIAAKYGYTDIASSLINAGADVGALDRYNLTALFFALDGGHVETVKLLIANGAVKNLKRFGEFFVSEVFKGNNEMVKALLVEASKIDKDTLKSAYMLGQSKCSTEVLDAIKELLEKRQ